MKEKATDTALTKKIVAIHIHNCHINGLSEVEDMEK